MGLLIFLCLPLLHLLLILLCCSGRLFLLFWCLLLLICLPNFVCSLILICLLGIYFTGLAYFVSFDAFEYVFAFVKFNGRLFLVFLTYNIFLLLLIFLFDVFVFIAFSGFEMLWREWYFCVISFHVYHWFCCVLAGDYFCFIWCH